MPNCSAAAVLLIQVHHKIKNFLSWGAINIIAKMWKNLPRSVLFEEVIRKLPVLLLNIELFHMCFSQFAAIRLVVPYGKTCYSYIIDSSCFLPSTEEYDVHHHYSINGVCSWLSEGKEFVMAHIVQDSITFCTPFPNRLWMYQVYCL